MQTDHENTLITSRQGEHLEDFCRDNPICAVLTPWQVEKLCRVFEIELSELEANFDGWCKHVLMSKDAVFVFPRNPGCVNAVKRELSLYEQLRDMNSIAIPRLIKRVKDKEISYYEFGAITRLKGVRLSALLPDLAYDELEGILIRLAEVIARFHSTPQDQLPKFLFAPAKPEPKRITIDNWHKHVLRPTTTEEAVKCIYRLVRRVSAGIPLPQTLAMETQTTARWTATLRELAELPHTLVHGDIHEDHVLIEQPGHAITGIIDWQTARIDNPVWDFNFGEWGFGISRWWNQLPALRRSMWRRYLETQGMRLSTLEGLNLFYALWDMVWMLYKRRNGPYPVPLGAGYKESVVIYLDRLESITAGLEG